MNVLILAAGYATRLYPLTLDKAKPLLVVGGKSIIEWVVDNLAGVPDLETIYVVTNNKFASDFQAWSERYRSRHPDTAAKKARFLHFLKEAGGEGRKDIRTYFDLIEFDEGKLNDK